jgi:hypothetical protein
VLEPGEREEKECPPRNRWKQSVSLEAGEPSKTILFLEKKETKLSLLQSPG